MSYIIRVDQETGKYIVKSTRYPGFEASADSFYRAIEEFEKCVRSRRSIEVLDEGQARPATNEILVTISDRAPLALVWEQRIAVQLAINKKERGF